MRSESHSRITVAASLTIAEQLMPRWLVSLQADAARRNAAAPQVILTAANSDQVIAAVHDGSADLGFIESPGTPAGLRSRVIAHDELVAVVPPDHKWARRSVPVSPTELNKTALVSRETGSGTREALSSALRSALGPSSRQSDPAIELSSAAAMRAAVLAGAGPAVMSRLAVDDDLTLGSLREVPIAGLDLRRELRAIWSGGRTPPAGAVRELLSHIASHQHRRE
jgi:DNA-binding transcriptional LysR family regulator